MTRAVNTALAGSGGVLQVVSTAKNDAFTTTSTTMVDITGLSVTITPTSSSSKFLIIANISGSMDSWSDGRQFFNLVRNSTNAITGTGGSSFNITAMQNLYANNTGNTAENTSYVVINYLDSPATTSSLTYKIQCAKQLAVTATPLAINRQSSSTTAVGVSTITVMEIAG